jgi:hypothetical protein
VDTEILDLLDNCNYRSISEISSGQTFILLCVFLKTVIGKDWEHSFNEHDCKHRISKIATCI